MMSNGALGEDNGDDKVFKLESEVNLWLIQSFLPVIPILVPMAQLFFFAKGDLDVFLTLVSETDLRVLLFALIFAYIGLGFLWFPSIWIALPMATSSRHELALPKRVVPWLRRRLIAGAAIALTGGLFVSISLAIKSLILALVTAGLCLILVRYSALRGPVLRVSEKVIRCDEAARVKYAKELKGGPRAKVIALIAAAPLMLTVATEFIDAIPRLAFSQSFPLPESYLTLKDEDAASWGYVLSTDNTSLKFAYIDGGIRYIPLDQVKSRFYCPSQFHSEDYLYLSGSGYQLLYHVVGAIGTIPERFVDPGCQDISSGKLRLKLK